MSLFEQFDEEARRCIFMARLAAAIDKSKTIGTTQILAGIRKENPALFRGVNWQRVSLPMSRLSPENLHRVSAAEKTTEIPLDPKAERTLKVAAEVAKKTGKERVTSAHLLAAVLSIDAKIRKQLEKAGLSKESVETKPAKQRGQKQIISRSGIGYDLHRLTEKRKLMIGGIEVPFERGSVGHSDGDVLCHAICDALLGAASMGDIGMHFPDTDEKWRGVSSLVFVRQVRQYLERKSWKIAHIDAVVIAERPKLGPHFPNMRTALSKSLGILPEQINLKAKTQEGLGEIGRGEAIAAHVIATIES